MQPTAQPTTTQVNLKATQGLSCFQQCLTAVVMQSTTKPTTT